MFWLGLLEEIPIREMTDDELMARIGSQQAPQDRGRQDRGRQDRANHDRAERAKRSFDELYRRHSGLVLGYAQRILGDRASAEDTAQETWMKLIGASQNYQAQNQFRPWLLTLTRNAALSRRRQRKMGRDFPTPIEEKENLADDTQDLQRFLQQRDDQRALRQALDHLPDAFRVCLALRWIEGLDYHSIAQATGMSLANVKTSIHRGRQELRHRIEKMGLYSNEEPRSEGESS